MEKQTSLTHFSSNVKLSISELSLEHLDEVIAFISQKEYTCVALMSHLIKNKEPCLPPLNFRYFIFSIQKESFLVENIVAVIAISDTGLVLHHIPEIQNELLAKALYPYVEKVISSFQIYCILGKKEGSDFITKTLKRTPKEIRQYELMTYDNDKKENFEQNEEFSKYLCKLCTPKDTDLLYPLQKEYELVEVLPKGEFFNSLLCKVNLKKQLSFQYVIGLFEQTNLKFVAKAGTNAQGLNWVQIGGVYTIPALRRKGIACCLVKKIATTMKCKKVKTCLFVNIVNTTAKHAYENAGFISKGLFSITYF